jgi:hypothetical protein
MLHRPGSNRLWSPAQVSAMAETTPLLVLESKSAANTAAATSGAIDLTGYEGVVAIVINTGAITGTMDPKLQDCDTSGGTYADIAGKTAAQVSTANQTRVITVDVREARRFLKFVGTVVTGPVLISVTLVGTKKVTG